MNALSRITPDLLYNNKKSSFYDLLEKDSSVSIHHRNLRALATEMYKIYNGTTPEIVKECFPLRSQGQYNLRSQCDFTLPIIRTVNYGIESIRYLGPKILESIPANIKQVEIIEHFKSGIKKWKPECCLCRLWKAYLEQIGYM